MSRSGYIDDIENEWAMICWRGAVASAIRGARGQALLREMLAALDAMPQKRLIADDLERGGEVCALGAVGRKRGIDMSGLDPEDRDIIAGAFGIAPALAAEITFMNDEYYAWKGMTPELRFEKMRGWIAKQIRSPSSPPTGT